MDSFLLQNKSIYKQMLSRTDKLLLNLYLLYFILNPIYLWRSGLPQIADLVLLFSSIIFLFRNKFILSSRYKSFIVVGLTLAVWIILVNSIWIFKLQTYERFLMSTFMYIYNIIISIYIIQLVCKYKQEIYKRTFWAVLISVIIELIVYLTVGKFEGSRAVGSFNNPNQLGYYSILILTFLIFLSDKNTIRPIWFIIGVVATSILTLASLSKAAILSIFGIFVLYFLSTSKNKKFKRNIMLFAIITSLIFSWLYISTEYINQNELIISVKNRIENIGNGNDDSLEGRGYYRIYNFPEYWLFGAGEGEYTRFNLRSMEFHSTLGNIQVSYGIIGSLIFYSLIYIALKRDNYSSWYLIFFILVYGLTHNGIRNSLFWILLALIASTNNSTFAVKKSV